jgi:hypothetical protein
MISGYRRIERRVISAGSPSGRGFPSPAIHAEWHTAGQDMDDVKSNRARMNQDLEVSFFIHIKRRATLIMKVRDG